MAKHTIKGHIVWMKWTGQNEGQFKFQDLPAYQSESYKQVDVCAHELTFDVPDDFDPRPGQIAALQEERDRLRAAFAARVTEIDRQISELQAITFDAKVAA